MRAAAFTKRYSVATLEADGIPAIQVIVEVKVTFAPGAGLQPEHDSYPLYLEWNSPGASIFHPFPGHHNHIKGSGRITSSAGRPVFHCQDC